MRSNEALDYRDGDVLVGARYSYRLVDVSSIKVLARLWHGESAVYQKPDEGAHDALFDIKQSILELSHYRKHLFRKHP